MKKWFLVLASIFVLLLAGCGSTPPADSGSQTQAPAAQGEAPKAEAPKAEEPANPSVILATTTSTQDSGLLDALIPDFEQATGYKIKTIAVGTGQALAMGEKGEADVLLVHAPASEKKLVDEKTAVNYQLVMHNDFVLVGPKSDPAKVKGMKTVAEAFKAISNSQSLFVSRGDDSGTDKKEKSLWKGVNIKAEGKWYQESGSGMGQTLNIASEKSGYALTDRATFLSLQKNLALEIVVEGEKSLLNIYHIMQVNPEKFPKVNADGAKAFVDFMIDAKTQAAIAEFGKDKFGQSLFIPDAGKSDDAIGK